MSDDDPQAELRAIGARARKKAIRRALVLTPSLLVMFVGIAVAVAIGLGAVPAVFVGGIAAAMVGLAMERFAPRDDE